MPAVTRMSLSLCILQTDHLHEALAEPFVGYGHMFQQLFHGQPLPVSSEVFDVVQGHYPSAESRYDAFLITGSKADAFSDEPWVVRLREYVRERYAAGDRLIGICFGHQLIAHALGGRTDRSDKGWGLGVQRYRLHVQPDWMHPPLQELHLQASHQDQVHALPEGAVLLASNDFCPHAAYHVGDRLLCFQGHPEFPDGYARELLNIRRERLGEELYRRATESLQQPHHGRAVGEWMLRFIAQPRA